MAFIERQDSQQTELTNLFEDDPKAMRKKQAALAAAQRPPATESAKENKDRGAARNADRD